MGIYLDNAATTYVYPEVAELMRTYYTGDFFNPSAVYSAAGRVREKISAARKTIGDIINAEPEEIYFTSGGTESDNWVCNEAMNREGHIITTSIEHKAVLKTLEKYKKKTLVRPDDDGYVRTEDIISSIRNDTVLISVMMANNEIGTIQPVTKIGEIASEYGVIFHTDAVQTFGHMPVDVKKMKADMLSASAHKFHGPKGCGFLYVSHDTAVSPFIKGGGQEAGMRAGTENAAGIIGMAAAAEISVRKMKRDYEWQMKIRDYMIKRLTSEIDNARINGGTKKRLANNINISFKNVDGRALLVMLDIEGIYASGGSACNSGSPTSYVLKEINVPDDYINGSIRLTLSPDISVREADYVIMKIKKCVAHIREQAK